MSDRTFTEEAQRILAEFEAARVRQAANRAASQRRGVVIAGISLRVGLALLCVGVLAGSTDSCWSTLQTIGLARHTSDNAPNLVAFSFYKILLDWPYWIKMIVVVFGAISFYIGVSQLMWSLREIQKNVEQNVGRRG